MPTNHLCFGRRLALTLATVAAKKIARAEKNARLFSGILSNDPKLFIFFS
jgi:hypothetical protein